MTIPYCAYGGYRNHARPSAETCPPVRSAAASIMRQDGAGDNTRDPHDAHAVANGITEARKTRKVATELAQGVDGAFA
jgi:hypothetical protein